MSYWRIAFRWQRLQHPKAAIGKRNRVGKMSDIPKVNKGENLKQSTAAGRTAFQDTLNKWTKHKCGWYSGLTDLLIKTLITFSDESL